MYKSVLVIILILLSAFGYSQDRPDTIVGHAMLVNSRTFFAAIDDFSKLSKTPNQLTGLEKKSLFYNFKKKFKLNNTSLNYATVIPVQNSNTFFSAGFVWVIKNKIPFLFVGDFIISPSDNFAVCDSGFYKYLNINGINLNKFKKKERSPCVYHIVALKDKELALLSNIASNKYLDTLLDEYVQFFIDMEILLDSSFDFYSPANVHRNPYCLTLKNLFLKGEFTKAKKLLYTSNEGFNWFIAEGLCYLNEKRKFLDKKTLRDAQRYNGKKMMKKFRSDQWLDNIYFPKPQ